MVGLRELFDIIKINSKDYSSVDIIECVTENVINYRIVDYTDNDVYELSRENNRSKGFIDIEIKNDKSGKWLLVEFNCSGDNHNREYVKGFIDYMCNDLNI